MITIIAFILILSILIFVHELGHFIVAKRSGITVEEFAIGFPPRAVKVWQDEGQITLDGHEFTIPRDVTVSRKIQPGTQIYAETDVDDKGRPIVVRLQPIEINENEPDGKAKADSEARFFNLFSFGSRKSKQSAPADLGPTVTVDALTRPTEYSINWIPLGGYVRMVGEEDPTDPGSFASKSKRVRLAVLAAGSIMNLIAAVFFFTLTSMSGVPETVVGTLITDIVPNTPAQEAGLQAGDVIIGADGVGFKYDGDLISYVEKTKGTEITLHLERGSEMVDAAVTPRVNPPEGQGAIGIAIKYEPLAQILVKDVKPNTPAQKAGLQPGDIILGAGDTVFKYMDGLSNYLEKTKKTEITLHVERDGKAKPVSLVFSNPPESQDELGIDFDFNLDTRISHYSFPEAFVRGTTDTAQYVSLVFYLPVAILRNIVPAEAARPTGPVGIYQQTDSAVNAAVSLNWWFPVLWLTAILSTALAVTNLLPLPALDGGRILFVIIEALRGKRIAPEKEGAIHFIGLALLLFLMLVISYYDVSNPIPAIDWANLF